MYIYFKQICCKPNNPVPIYYGKTECCSGYSYNPFKSGCCGNTIYSLEYEKCCKPSKNEKLKINFYSQVFIIHIKKDKPIQIESEYSQCCGKQLIDAETELCCGPDYPVKKKNGINACCGYIGYNDKYWKYLLNFWRKKNNKFI